jgi:hypothetical protein
MVSVLACTAMAHAQLGGGVADNEGKLEPPTPQFKVEETGETMPMIWAFLLVAAAIGANLVPAKRGHQD